MNSPRINNFPHGERRHNAASSSTDEVNKFLSEISSNFQNTKLIPPPEPGKTKEFILKVDLSEKQKRHYLSLLKYFEDDIRYGRDRERLQNMAIQLLKCCNSPFLFNGTEHCPPFEDHFFHTGKLQVLDKLLSNMKSTGRKVIILSLMKRMLDILEDCLNHKKYEYFRHDRNSEGDCDISIDALKEQGSDTFVQLLFTRGGSCINLPSSYVIIFYDNDWNPQLEYRYPSFDAIANKDVVVYRLCTKDTIEEAMILRAKLALKTHMRDGQAINVSDSDLLHMVKFVNMDMFYSCQFGSTMDVRNYETIIEEGEKSTKEFDDKIEILQMHQYRNADLLECLGGEEGIEIEAKEFYHHMKWSPREF